MKSCKVCGDALVAQGDIIECLHCQTVYDLVNRKIDTSKTIVEPIECKHRNRMLLQGTSGHGQNHNVTVCEDCGEIEIYGRTAEHQESFHVRIVVWSQEFVNTIGKAARLIPDQPGF